MISYKRNYIVFFSVYFVARVIQFYVNAYLPIYFFNVLDVDRVELAFVQIVSYTFLFVKPLISVYYDKKRERLKLLLLLGSLGIFISFILFITSLALLLLFGVLLGINFAFISVADVAVDKIVVEYSPTNKIKDKNALCLQMGGIFGAILPNLLFMVVISDVNAVSQWTLFFMAGIVLVLPFSLAPFLFKPPTAEMNEVAEEYARSARVELRPLLLTCAFLFLVYAMKLYEYPLEPWALIKLGEGNEWMFSLFMIVFILLNAIGFVIATVVSSKFDRKKVLIWSTIISGLLLIIAPFLPIFTFFVVVAVIQITSGFVIINMISVMIQVSRGKVLYFQVMATFILLASLVFVPLGTYLSASIATEVIIAIAGALQVLSVIPVYFMKDIGKEE